MEKFATNEQVKKSYRDLAKKHHPDKVQHLGDVYVKAAQDKFQQIQKAYQNIKDERGFWLYLNYVRFNFLFRIRASPRIRLECNWSYAFSLRSYYSL